MNLRPWSITYLLPVEVDNDNDTYSNNDNMNSEDNQMLQQLIPGMLWGPLLPLLGFFCLLIAGIIGLKLLAGSSNITTA